MKDTEQSLGEAMLHSVRRGTADLRHGLVQGAGHIATALTRAAAETLDSDTLRRGATAMDKRLQSLDELRRVAQGEVFPIDLGEESSFMEELAVDAAGAVPGAALAFMGGAGFGALSLAGTGAAVAEARRRSPKVNYENEKGEILCHATWGRAHCRPSPHPFLLGSWAPSETFYTYA
jgi:hypothetical protein